MEPSSFLPKRIMIFGLSGSGKSTFALKLSRLLNYPLYHLDKYFFVSKWQERNYEEFLHIQKELVEKENWIIDGNARRSLEMRFCKADLILYFRFNRAICLWRICKRRLYKNPDISDRAEGCREIIQLPLLTYLWQFHKKVEPSIDELCKKYPNTPFYKLQNDNQAKACFAPFKMAASPKKPCSRRILMTNHPIVLERYDTIPQEYEGLLLQGLSTYASQEKNVSPIQPFSLFLKQSQTVVGGISAATFYGSLYIDSLWIDQDIRHQGWGTKLMQETEKIAKEQKATFAVLHTMDWEGLSFYQKLGYSIEFVREGYEKNAKMFLLRKNL